MITYDKKKTLLLLWYSNIDYWQIDNLRLFLTERKHYYYFWQIEKITILTDRKCTIPTDIKDYYYFWQIEKITITSDR